MNELEEILRESLQRIDNRIDELTRKADRAQASGNYEAMKEYDRELELWKEEKFKVMQSIYSEEDSKKQGSMGM